ncbi:RHH-fold DNA-binding protein [Halanaeroarchaeum sp. HSR-CO]|uniref:double zinc ribbon domain-containing protein n=1 Tax=Halanaeroarchaeum sp. HSR-CO TaxID=2866382 RepID=UPI00217CF7A2|nr:zinc ribbon domain-containing protein [Halanaeroarchaeum sp. HSR-CO]UWG47160.1 RHH-fold DNA-binding protein [Halanaeroarchaeum sp. HSR-CO]
MSKITFRADDDLVDAVEALDRSKSEIMRDALRTYLESDARPETVGRRPVEQSLDEMISRRVDEVLSDRLEADTDRGSDVNVTIEVDGAEAARATTDHAGERGTGSSAAPSDVDEGRRTDAIGRRTCAQCGTTLEADHVYCPNCGDHAAQAFHCECGEQLQPDWSFCPDCGRRTASAEFLER